MNSPQSQSPPRFPLSWLMALACLGLGVLTGLAFITRQDGVTIIIGLIGMACCFFTIIAFLNDLRFWLREGCRPRSHGIYLALTLLIGPFSVFIIFHGLVVTGVSAQVRSMVSRCRGDMRTHTIALEEYYQHHKTYPAWSLDRAENAFGGLSDTSGTLIKQPTFAMRHDTQRITLTTPVAYSTSHFADVFSEVRGATFCYWATPATSQTAPGYIIWSAGPDQIYDITIDNVAKAYDPAISAPSALLAGLTYDPSNGAHSGGDVYRYKQ